MEEPETDTATAPVVLEPEIPKEMEEPEELPTMADLFGKETVQEATDGMASATQPAIQRSAPMAISDIEDQQQKAQKREELQAKLALTQAKLQASLLPLGFMAIMRGLFMCLKFKA